MAAPWMISVRNGNKKKNILFPLSEGETQQENLERVKKTYIELVNKYPNYTIEIISRKTAFPPKKKPKSGYIYCPYCRKDRLFQFHYETSYYKCPVCGISDNDFYVRKYNKLTD